MSWGQLDCENYGKCKHNPTPSTCNRDCKYYRLGHYTDGRKCWCDPEVEIMENGSRIYIHREEN